MRHRLNHKLCGISACWGGKLGQFGLQVEVKADIHCLKF